MMEPLPLRQPLAPPASKDLGAAALDAEPALDARGGSGSASPASVGSAVSRGSLPSDHGISLGHGRDADAPSQAAALRTLGMAGMDRGMRPLGALMLSALVGGAYIAVGAAVYLRAQQLGLGAPAAALLFPVGLSMVVTSGSDLLTSNMLYALLPLLLRTRRRSRRHQLGNLTRLLALSAAGNALACGTLGILAVRSGVLASDALVVGLAQRKVGGGAMATLLKAVGANWMVNLAVLQGTMAQSWLERLVMLWLPIAAFVLLGLEHSVANTFFLPAGWAAGAGFGLGEALLSNLLPCAVGNLLGALLFAKTQLVVSRVNVL